MNYEERKLNKLLYLAPFKKNISALDIGCGTGEITSFFDCNGYKTKGIDIDSDAIAIAQQRYPNSYFEIKDIKDVDYSKYEVIISWGALEYNIEMFELLKKIEREMKEDSILIFAVPNVCSFSKRIKCLFGQNPNKEKHIHYTFNFKQIKKLIDKTNFKYKEITTLYVDGIKNFYFPTLKNFSSEIIVKLVK